MGVRFANRVKTTLSAGVAIGDTTLSLSNAANLPAIGGGDYCYLTLTTPDQATIEVVKATALAGNVVTVARAQEGTAAVAWAMGSAVELRLTRQALLDALADYLPLVGGSLSDKLTVTHAGEQLRLGYDLTKWVSFTVDAARKLYIGGDYPETVGQVVIRYSGAAGYGGSGLFIQDQYYGGGVVLQVSHGSNSLYLTDATGTAVPLTLGTWLNPTDGSSFVAAYQNWNITSGNLNIQNGNLSISGSLTGTSASFSGDVSTSTHVTHTLTGGFNFKVGGPGEGWIYLRQSQGFPEAHIRPEAGKKGVVSFTENAVADRWSVGIKPADGNLYFSAGDTGLANIKMTLSSAGALSLVAGISATTGAFTGNVTVKGGLWIGPAGSELPIQHDGTNGYIGTAFGKGNLNLQANGATQAVIQSDGQAVFNNNIYARDVHASRGDGTGVIFLNAAAGAYVYWDTTNYNLPGGGMLLGGAMDATSPGSGSNGGYRLRAPAGDGLAYFQVTNHANSIEWGNWAYGSNGYATWNGSLAVSGTNTTYNVGYTQTRSGQVGYHMYNLGGVSEWLIYQPAPGVGHDLRFAGFAGGVTSDRFKLGTDGNAYVIGSLNVSGEIWANGNILRFGGAGAAHYLWWDGTNYQLGSGGLIVGGNITSTSDARLKSNIRQLEGGLGIALQLRGVRYDMDDREHVGVVAQEVRAVLPEVVLENTQGYLSVDYGRLTAVLIEAVKELQAEVEQLKARLA